MTEPKTVETIEEVESVSEEEMAELDKSLKEGPTEADKLKAEALKSQSQLRTLGEIIADLSKPIHPKYLKKLTAGGGKGATYIPWPVVGKYLDHFAPGWSMTQQVVTDDYGTNVVATIGIPTSDFGRVERSGVGFEPHVTNKGKANEKITGFGGAGPIASRQACKRSAAEFGLGKYLYIK